MSLLWILSCPQSLNLATLQQKRWCTTHTESHKADAVSTLCPSFIEQEDSTLGVGQRNVDQFLLQRLWRRQEEQC